MKINHIELKNFKFHHDLEFDIKEKNCLIYGENGTGKSSIYEALYSNFYYFKNKNSRRLDVRETYRHRDYRSEDMIINILFDNKESLNRKDNDLESEDLLKNKVIYFANERVLREITEENFYNVLKNILQEHFPLLNNLFKGYTELERKLRRGTADNLIKERLELDKKFRIQFNKTIPLYVINNILKNNFDEKFEIEFKVEDSIIENKELIYPKISIAVKGIDDRGNFQNHFNEAKLKLIGIAIYFALAKKYETKSELKLLVLDDFLTSLDMANRKLIVQYILEDFEDYQKIILTHNIQFYNMIIKLLNMRGENKFWDIKNLFLTQDTDKEKSVMDNKENYIKEAKTYLKEGKIEISGNFLRKEFERINNEFKQILELGKTEELGNIINSFISSKRNIYFENPHKTLNDVKQIVENKHPNNRPIENILNLFERTGNIISSKDKSIKHDLNDMRNTLERAKFYQGVLMHPASHDDNTTEIYRKECLSSIQLLEELNSILDRLKQPALKNKKVK